MSNRPAAELLESRRLLAATITEFSALSDGLNEKPTQIVSASDGTLWFTEPAGTDSTIGAGEIGAFDPATDQVADQILTAEPNALPVGIVATPGTDGEIWYSVTADYQLGEVPAADPTTKTFYNYEYGAPYSPYNAGAGLTSLGNDIWATVPSANGLLEFDPSTDNFVPYSLAPANINVAGFTSQITAGPDGNLWFTEPGAIGIFSPVTDTVIGQVSLPTADGTQMPAAITVGPDDNIWFTESAGSTAAVGVINAATEQYVTEFALPTGSEPEGITAGPDGNVWFAESGTGQIGMIDVESSSDPTQDSLGSSITIPTSGQPGGAVSSPDPQGIVEGPDGNLWFTDSSGALGVVTLNTTSALTLTSTPLTSVTAVGFGLTVSAEYSSGDVNAGFDGSVTATLYNSNNVSVGSQTMDAVNGVAAFSGLTVDTADSGYTITITSSATNPPTLLTTGSFNVVPASPAKFVFTTPPPGSVIAGSPFGLTVELEDNYDNVATNYSGTVTAVLANNPGGSTLGGTTSAIVSPTGNSPGYATFTGLSLNKSDNDYTLTISDGNGLSMTTAGIDIVPASPAKFVFTTPPPGSVAAGSPFGLTVELEDNYDNVATNYSGTVTAFLANNPGGSTLGGTTSAIVSPTGSNPGYATFTDLSLNKSANDYVLTIFDGNGLSMTTAGIDIVPASPAELVFTTPPPGSVTAGSPFGLTVELEDIYDNVATNYSGTVTAVLANNPGGSTLGGSASAIVSPTGSSPGYATFTGLSLNKSANDYALTISDGNGLAMTTAGIDIVPASPAKFVFTTPPPGSVIAGSPFGLTVELEDNYDNVATNFSGTVTAVLANNPGGSTLGGSASAIVSPTGSSPGYATFTGLSLNKSANDYTLTISDGNGLSMTTAGIDIVPASPAELVFTTPPPGSVAAGSPFGLTVELEDNYDNVATNYSGTVTAVLANNPGGSTLGGSASAIVSPTGSSPGYATFTGLSLNKSANDYTLTISDGDGLAMTTAGIDIVAASPAKLVFTTLAPGSVAAGSPFGLTVELEDAYDNVATNYSGTVTATLANNPGGSTMGGSASASVSPTGSNPGYATFTGLWLNKADSAYVLNISTSSGLSLPTAGINVTPATASQLVIVSSPTGTLLTGSSFDFMVVAEDRFGNIAPGYNGTAMVAIANNPGGASLSGPVIENLESTGATPGFAKFTGLSLNQPGNGYILSVSAAGLSSATTSAFNISPEPTVTSVLVATTQIKNKKGRVTKTVISGYTIVFNTAMDQGTINSSGDYVVETAVATKKTKNRPATTKFTRVGFSVQNLTSTSLTITPVGSPFKTKAGQISFSRASAVQSNSGFTLSFSGTFAIANGGKSISIDYGSA